jgi:hypothetical protein
MVVEVAKRERTAAEAGATLKSSPMKPVPINSAITGLSSSMMGGFYWGLATTAMFDR